MFDHLSEKEREVLATALKEFVDARTPPVKYTRHRYNDHDDAFVMIVVSEVDAQREIAEKMRKDL